MKIDCAGSRQASKRHGRHICQACQPDWWLQQHMLAASWTRLMQVKAQQQSPSQHRSQCAECVSPPPSCTGLPAEVPSPCPCRSHQLTPTSGLQTPMASRDRLFCTSMKCVHSATK